MTEITISSAALVALDELKERRPSTRYDANVLKELRMNGFIADVAGGWITINKRGLDALYPPDADTPAATKRVSAPAPAAPPHERRKPGPKPGKPRKTSKARTLPVEVLSSAPVVSTPSVEPSAEPLAVESASFDDMPPLKSRADIDALMKQWVADPSWVLEATPGFEAHADELGAFSYGWKDFWREEGFAVPDDTPSAADNASCAGDCAGCFDHRALEYLMSRNPAISTLVQRYAEYDRANAALNEAGQRLQAFHFD